MQDEQPRPKPFLSLYGLAHELLQGLRFKAHVVLSQLKVRPLNELVQRWPKISGHLDQRLERH